MKFDVFKFIIFSCLSGLMAWAGYELGDDEGCKLMLAIGTGVSLLALSVLLCINLPEYPRSQANLHVLSYVCAIVSLIMNFAFSFFVFYVFVYVLLNAVLVLLTLVIARGIIRSKM